MTVIPVFETPASQPAASLGLARLMRLVQSQEELAVVVDGLKARLAADETDAGALRDISTLLIMGGQLEQGLELQAHAIGLQPCYAASYGSGEGPRILAFMAPGDLMANTPLDFLLESADAQLVVCYLDGPPPPPERLPPHDLAFLAVGQSDAAAPLLASLAGAFEAWPRPVVNGRPDVIATLSREGVAARLWAEPSILCPQAVRLSRAQVAELALRLQSGEVPPPLIIRPVGSHAGRGLEKIDDALAVAGYLAARPEAEFYVSQFVDYSGPDGLFRKLRIAFVDGRPFVCHLAVSEHWMVHYLNAGMDQSAAKRAEEAALMAGFDEAFVPRNAEALAALARLVPLDYFAIDCAELADGRLLVFEADTAMIVHAQDPVDLYPYKPPAMAKLFAAFLGLCARRARAGGEDAESLAG